MDDLAKRAITGALKFYAVLAVLIFLPAWSLAYWQGWVYWLVLLVCTLAPSAYFLKHDRALVERRMAAGPAAEREPTQKVIQSFLSAFGILTILVAVLDHRMQAAAVPVLAVIAADVAIVIGFAAIFATMRENSFAAATIVISPGQTVVRTGPYAWVRHPMYSGALLAFLATPVALGSWWGLVPAAGVVAMLAWRTLDEERFLIRNLPGYAEYRRDVRFRLVPGLW